jgi:hypothetical protein
MSFRDKQWLDNYPDNYAEELRDLAELMRRRSSENVEQQYQQALQKFLKVLKESREGTHERP